MLLVLSSIEDAFRLSSSLDKSYFDKADSFSENRARTYLAGRALLHSVLEKFYSVKTFPSIIKTEKGKPFFKDKGFPFFNISHSRNTICLGVSEFDIGIDIETVKKRVRFEELKEKVLSSGEQDLIKNLDADSQLREFTAFWTMRESLLKLSGFGLVHLEKLKVDIEKSKVTYDALNSANINNRFLTTVNLSQYDSLSDAETYLSYTFCKGETCSFYELDKNKFTELASPKSSYTFTVN